MDVTDILPQIDRLDGELDTLDAALQPLLGSVSDVAAKLPLLDKAKLYVLVTYSIESMLFSSLRLNAVDAKNHPVFKELTRVRQYFEKIKNIENPAPPPPKPDQSLNKEAAIRFIRADLADNKEVNTKLTEMIAKERAKAALKASAATAALQKSSGGGGLGKRKGTTDAAAAEAAAGEESGPSSEESGVAKSASEPRKGQGEPPAKKSKKKDRKEKKDKKAKKDHK
ncbi:hypothetical protein SLS62_001480 [Diatrype stigma]|uniref:Exosome complex protein n=1 Tax=Diatrype stigma TaxID=117547 RepID=A0AAN9UYD8_9PEZI